MVGLVPGWGDNNDAVIAFVDINEPIPYLPEA